MDVQHVTAFARERLGMEIQGASLAPSRAADNRALEVWALLTEHGWFWLVEGEGAIELFRATHYGPPSAAEATRRFLELHPSGPARPTAVSPAVTRSPAPGPRETPAPYDCCICGVQVTPRRPSEQADRRLCEHCFRAERARERYHGDPEHRARRLAAVAARKRRRPHGNGP